MRLMPFAVAAVVLLQACTFVEMKPGAQQVRVYPIGQSMATCRNLGELEVSITSQVGPYQRDGLTIKDELETLARNEALTLHADSVQPIAVPANGSQHWMAFACHGN